MSQRISTCYVRITTDANGDLLYTIVPFNLLLVELVTCRQVIHWWVPVPGQQADYCEIHIYYPSSAPVPVGERLEEINRRAVAAIEEQEGR